MPLKIVSLIKGRVQIWGSLKQQITKLILTRYQQSKIPKDTV